MNIAQNADLTLKTFIDMIYNQQTIISEKFRAQISVDEFLDSRPSIFEIQAYIQMARNDLVTNPNDIYAAHVIRLLSGDTD
jgi:hypothetical protein